MTLEGQGPGEDQTPAPPARTRWSEDEVDDADVLLPPYVPGRAASKPGARAEQAPPADAAEAHPPAGSSGGSESEEPWAESATPGTFAAPEPEAVAGTVEPERAASVEPEGEPEPDSHRGSDDYPWEVAGGDEAFEGEGEAVPVPEAESRKDADPWPPEEPEGEDAFPFAAFDIEGFGEDAAPRERGEPEGSQELEESLEESSGPASPSSPAAAGADAMAERVERLAEALRREGRSGVEREMGSEDRLTSLLAGVLAGYLAGRED